MDNKKLIKVSKYLSRHLRHEPESIGIVLDSAGWCDVSDLLSACAANNMTITRAELDAVVAENDKQRFAFSPDGKRIRASQGHSIDVDLELSPVSPPDVLYHGTGAGSVAPIREKGLRKMNRHHVHLTDNTETAVKVGARHGKPVVFTVDAQAMRRTGHVFYRSENGVYLVDDVPPQYLSLAGEEED
ncbi:MAG: RNA 2'-phosphotransferase [Armatimonadetes bacterium]|nr:RNA 2'-phosphotransferase [Armatimonadota bacterium]